MCIRDRSHDKHSVWVNTYTLEMCGITKETQVPPGNIIEREADGTPRGTLREFAAIALVDSVKPVFGKEHYKEAFSWVQKEFAKYGVTTIMDPLLDPEEEAIDAIKELNDEGKLICKMRGAFKSSEAEPYKHIDDFARIREEVDSHMFKIEQVKMFADGVPCCCALYPQLGQKLKLCSVPQFGHCLLYTSRDFCC